MARPTFGLEFFRVDDQPKPVIPANMDVVGIVGPCSTADATVYPLNTPVFVYSNDLPKLAKLGDAFGVFDGYIKDAIDAVNAQLADFQVAAQLVIVRTPYGTSGDAAIKLQQTIAHVMGSSVTGSGIWALLKAPTMLYVTPRLIMAPGYTGQMANSLDTLVTAVAGTGYIPNAEYTVAFANGNGETNGANLVLPTAHALADANGEIHDNSIYIDSYGAWMTAAPTATLPAADGPDVVAEPASGSLIFSRQPGIGSTISLGGTAIQFVSGSPGSNEVQIGANLAATLANLKTALNASSDAAIDDNTYDVDQGTLLIVSDTPGAGGNTFTLGTTVNGVTLSGTTLTGGRDAGSKANATLTATIALGANPVCSMLPGILSKLIAHGIVESAGTSLTGDLNWRSTLSSGRLIGLVGGVKVEDPDSGDIVVRPFAPRVIGAIIARDFETGYPFHSAANRAINGIVGQARTIDFNLLDGDCEGQQLLSANLGILARGQQGIETAIASGGFIFVGTDNLDEDPLWTFYNVSRGRDFIHLSLMPTLRTYLGRSNITRQTVANVLGTINRFLLGLQAMEQILGSKVRFHGNQNSAEEIRLGHLTVGFQAEEPPVLRRITTMSARYRPAIDAMVASLETELNLGNVV